MVVINSLRKLLGIILLTFWATLLISAVSSKSSGSTDIVPQASFPDPPNDLTRVYYLNGEEKLLPLPFESGMTSLNLFLPAQKDRVAQVRLSGPSATTILTNDHLRFYVFVADKMDPPPHQLVRLTSKKAGRELDVSLIKGRKGYAPFESNNVRLEHRIVERLRVETSKNRYVFVNYMQLRPLKPLEPGEYAIIGDSLSDMATFHIQ